MWSDGSLCRVKGTCGSGSAIVVVRTQSKGKLVRNGPFSSGSLARGFPGSGSASLGFLTCPKSGSSLGALDGASGAVAQWPWAPALCLGRR
ncbi:hypothetical protein E5288_WYG011777 [Bos mutus]|uniref:Uncharacterized protein n=1 Tax=Bos mutus TaxID=72004 RepID=A0A6B0SHG9_9CETA|nr:hypothetical protein [Bos mutus]